jgi:hypothetical protein
MMMQQTLTELQGTLLPAHHHPYQYPPSDHARCGKYPSQLASADWLYWLQGYDDADLMKRFYRSITLPDLIGYSRSEISSLIS